MKTTFSIPLCLVTLVLAGCASETPQPAAAPEAAPAHKVAEVPVAAAVAPAETVADTTGGMASDPAAASDMTAAATDPTAVATGQMAEIGCGHCVYHMEGVTTCTPAISMNGTVVKLEGGAIDPESLCAKALKATVEGELKDGTFIATKVDVIHE